MLHIRLAREDLIKCIVGLTEVAWSSEQWAYGWMVVTFSHQTGGHDVGREIESATVPFISNSLSRHVIVTEDPNPQQQFCCVSGTSLLRSKRSIFGSFFLPTESISVEGDERRGSEIRLCSGLHHLVAPSASSVCPVSGSCGCQQPAGAGDALPDL